jgi:Fusaric acid resistance protein-like
MVEGLQRHLDVPARLALEGAARLALTGTAALLVTFVWLDLPQTALFAGFGSVSMLLLSRISGRPLERLGTLALVCLGGLPLIALGTICGRLLPAAVIGMAVVAFAILFLAFFDDRVAAVQKGLVLSFVLPVMVTATPAAIPDRLLGWGIAGVISCAASLLLWPAGRHEEVVDSSLVAGIAALADLVRGIGAATGPATARSDAALESARVALLDLERRPNGAGESGVAMARAVEYLGWLREAALRATRSPRSAVLHPSRMRVATEVAEALATVATGVQRHRREPIEAGIRRLEGVHRELGRDVIARVSAVAASEPRPGAGLLLEEGHALRATTFSAIELVAGLAEPAQERRPRSSYVSARTILDIRSVAVRDGLRGAAGLALAVLVGQVTDVQNSFWVVLGTLSVLRSDAVWTERTSAHAIVGTLVGIVIGGLAIVLVGGDEIALWALLPVTFFIAGFASQALSFIAGQAAFSLLVLIVLDLLTPSGWQSGLVRIEDVAIGAAVSVAVGILLWPRGPSSLLGEHLRRAYRDAADLLQSTILARLGEAVDLKAGDRQVRISEAELDATVHDLLRGGGPTVGPLRDVATLTAGARRLRRVAELVDDQRALVHLSPVDRQGPGPRAARDELEGVLYRRCDWFEDLADALTEYGPVPEPEQDGRGLPHDAGSLVLAEAPDRHEMPTAMAVGWAILDLGLLLPLEPPLAAAGARFIAWSSPTA